MSDVTPVVVKAIQNTIKVHNINQSIVVVVKPTETKIVTKVVQQPVTVRLDSPYVHPAVHPATMIVQDTTHQFITTAEREKLNAARHYVHDQQTASAEWSIPHPLNKHPAVSIVDSSGRLVIGNIQYMSNSLVIVSFRAKFAGRAYLN